MPNKMTVEQAVAELSKLAITYGTRRHRAAAEVLRAEIADMREELDATIEQRDLLSQEVLRLEKDAGRWRHARKLLTFDDIEGAQGAFDSFGGMVSEEECARADAAIDAAYEKE